jgi:hypothetical protein
MSRCGSQFIDGNGCYVIPECAGFPEVPASSSHAILRGWDSGAHSITSLPGPSMLTLSMFPNVQGVIIGISTDSSRVSSPGAICFGWYFTSGVACAIEFGEIKTAPEPYTESDVFQIRRGDVATATVVNGVVSTTRVVGGADYLKNGVVVRTSDKSFVGYATVGACLFASLDAAPAPASNAADAPGAGVNSTDPNGGITDGYADGTKDGLVSGNPTYASYGLSFGVNYPLLGTTTDTVGYAANYDADYTKGAYGNPP